MQDGGGFINCFPAIDRWPLRSFSLPGTDRLAHRDRGKVERWSTSVYSPIDSGCGADRVLRRWASYQRPPQTPFSSTVRARTQRQRRIATTNTSPHAANHPAAATGTVLKQPRRLCASLRGDSYFLAVVGEEASLFQSEKGPTDDGGRTEVIVSPTPRCCGGCCRLHRSRGNCRRARGLINGLRRTPGGTGTQSTYYVDW